MKCTTRAQTRRVPYRRDTSFAAAQTRRGGAVLIVVMSLLLTLTFIGFLFYSFASQEQASAEYFAYAEAPAGELPTSLFEDWALEQLIVGTRPSLGESALFGSNWALVPNMIGRPISPAVDLELAEKLALVDVNPFDGLGIGVWADASTAATLGNGEFVFDFDGNGAGDFDEQTFGINFSLSANAGVYPQAVAESFNPDAGYTYPDINSLFLAFDGYVRDPNNPTNIYRVIIPSFHRPQYFPFRRFTNGQPNPAGFGDIFLNAATVNQVLRPHAGHVNAIDGSPRFINPVDFPNGRQALSGDTTRIIQPFPFTPNINGGPPNQAGVWSLADPTLDPTDPNSTIYEFDVDNDGDGFLDSIWMDLDFPIMDLPDGKQFVPLFAFKVIDADGLLNVNAHGNMNGVLARQWNGTPIAPGDPTSEYVHASNLGLSRSEINLGMGLTANPATDLDPNVTLENAQFQHAANFGTNLATTSVPLAPEVLSNLELLMLLNGRENWRDDPSQGLIVDARIEGRWGEDFLIPNFYAWIRSAGAASFPGAASPGGVAMIGSVPVSVDDDGDSNMVGISPIFGTALPQYPMTLPPGFSQDDDISAPIGHPGGGSAYRDPNLLGLWVPPFVHPLDYGGTGAGYLFQSGAGSPITRRFAGRSGLATGVTSPARWPTYVDVPGAPTAFWQFQYTGWDPSTQAPVAGSTNMLTNPFVQDAAGKYYSLYGVLPYWQSLSRVNVPPQNELQLANALHDFLRDEGDEVILDRGLRDPEYDAVFSTGEMEGLHLSSADYEGIEGTSRLRDLAIVNFDKTNDVMGRLIRGRFTTDSWDRRDFGHGHSVNGTAVRDWEYTLWNGTTAPEFATTTSNVAFPPEFSAAAAGSLNDPLRPELRLLLKSEFGYNVYLNTNSGAARFPRHRLNINRILSDDDPTPNATTAFDANEDPRFRNLTPHPDIAALNLANTASWNEGQIQIPAMLHTNDPLAIPTTPVNVSFTNLGLPIDGTNGSDANRLSVAATQEWWARYDRQRLARDMYTLLYTLGHGDDSLNVTTQAYPATPDADGDGRNDYVEEMAQFAVNYVDALDRDDVITRFDYDSNLSDGWNPTGNDFVYGVEAQQLTLSEVLWIQTAEATMDEASTIWDDSKERQYLYIELRNASPFDVELRTDSWRIARYNHDQAGELTKRPGVDPPDASFVFKTEPGNNVRNVVKAGQTFLIGCHDNSETVNINGTDEIRSSDFYVNDGTGTGFDQIVPYRIEGTNTNEQALPAAASEHPLPTLDLDLSYTDSTGATDHQNRFEFDVPAPVDPDDPPMLNGNTLVSTGTDGAGTDWSSVTQFTLVLQRRANPRTDGIVANADSEENWIEVDRFEDITFRTFSPGGTLQDQLKQLQSFERSEPLDRLNVNPHAQDTAMPPRSHSLGAPDFVVSVTADNSGTLDRNRGNSNSPDPFTIWQPHFDRDFSSVFELLSVPLIGPSEVTEKLVDKTSKKLTGWYDESSTPKVPALAGARFLNIDPQGDSNPATPTTLADDNRWYRLFEFLTVPDNAEDAIRERLARLVRTPGKVNLNTIRDEAVLAAILDDPHINRFDGPGNLTDDSIQGPDRNWYRELLLARDGIDPLNALNGGPALPLPGVPGVPSDPTGGTIQFGAVPFRSESYVAPNLTDVWPPGANVNKTAHTLLRSHVTDNSTLFPNRAAGLENLGLFEAAPTGNTDIDLHTRNRLLAKVANHTTTRSNVFVVWLTVGFFEAHQPNPAQPTVVQIGAEMPVDEMPRQRAFFVIDRTRLEEAVQTDSSGVLTLNWRSFLLHRRTLSDE